MQRLRSNIRFYLVCFSILLSLAIYVWVHIYIPGERLQTIRLTQLYALTAITYLYITLLAGPFCYMFRWFPYRSHYMRARRAIGVSSWYFSVLHACFAFFGQLGGFEGLFFLSNKYVIAITLSFIALVILTVMAATAFDSTIAKLTFHRWKFIHRFVYLAGILLIVHAVMLGTHFQQLYEWIPQIFFTAVAFLLFLELLRIDAYLKKIFPRANAVHPVSVPLFGLFIFACLYLLLPLPANSTLSFGIHAQHIQLAREEQGNNSQLTNTMSQNIPSLQGDRTKRYTVSFIHDDVITPQTDIPLTFQVFDASSGNHVKLFQKLFDKQMHLIIVDSTLQSFSHIHPNFTNDDFVINTQFPKPGIYHLYLNFQPFGAIEQQFAFTLQVGSVNTPVFPTTKPDTTFDKTFGKYQISLAFPSPLQSSEISIGQQKLSFTIRDAKTKQPVKTLQPYLAAYGHLVMINEKTYEYIHVHPTNSIPPTSSTPGGPVVEFLPLGLYGPINPGIYRLFAQFNPNGTLMTADYTIEIK
jgi:DMSO/TMAO reductase YedYZ heme-binding membrane subunit